MSGGRSTPIPVAMLGGGVGSLMGETHRRAIEASGDFELVAGCFSTDADRNLETARSIGLDPARLYSDEHELVEREAALTNGAQVVSLLTPNHLHAEQLSVCLHAGWHVVCEKPVTRTVEEAVLIGELAAAKQRVVAVTHTYTGYQAVRAARSMIHEGAIGDVRIVQVEYAQGWLATPVEQANNRQAMWRTDPMRAGGGAIIDIGSHAGNLAEFVSGLTIDTVACDLSTSVPGRQVDDNANALLRFSSGASGSIWVSQVALGTTNDVKVRVFGSGGSVSWEFSRGERLKVWTPDRGDEVLVATPVDEFGLADLTWLPAATPWHYVDAFVRLYKDAAEHVRASNQGRPARPHASLLPSVIEGARAVAFVDACLVSSSANSEWTAIK